MEEDKYILYKYIERERGESKRSKDRQCSREMKERDKERERDRER